MTVTDLCLEAISYINASGGPTNLATLANATIPQKRRLATDLTATMQEIHMLAPYLYKRRFGVRLAAPAQANVTVTAGSDTFTTAYSFAEGSTISLGGVYNEVRTENGVKKLLFPFAGSSGTYSATFYDDCVLLPAGATVLTGPVVMDDNYRLAARVNRQDFRTGVYVADDYGRQRRLDITQLTVGQPSVYWVEPFLLTDGENYVSTLRMKFNPLPREPHSIGFDVKMDAPRFSHEDLGTDTVPSDRSMVVPHDYVESLVRPLFLRRWSASPWFRDQEKAAQMVADEKAARAWLTTYRPQQALNRRITAPI